MIPCKDVIHRLWDYLDAEATPELAEAIREHLEMCAGCRAVSEFEQALLVTVQGLVENPPADADLQSKVLAALHRHGYRGPDV
jgi:anti-sigma factor (TIGR02949 family)